MTKNQTALHIAGTGLKAFSVIAAVGVMGPASLGGCFLGYTLGTLAQSFNRTALERKESLIKSNPILLKEPHALIENDDITFRKVAVDMTKATVKQAFLPI